MFLKCVSRTFSSNPLCPVLWPTSAIHTHRGLLVPWLPDSHLNTFTAAWVLPKDLWLIFTAANAQSSAAAWDWQNVKEHQPAVTSVLVAMQERTCPPDWLQKHSALIWRGLRESELHRHRSHGHVQVKSDAQRQGMPISMDIRELSSMQSYMFWFLIYKLVPGEMWFLTSLHHIFIWNVLSGRASNFSVAIFPLTFKRNLSKFFSKSNFRSEMLFGTLTAMFRLKLLLCHCPGFI